MLLLLLVVDHDVVGMLMASILVLMVHVNIEDGWVGNAMVLKLLLLLLLMIGTIHHLIAARLPHTALALLLGVAHLTLAGFVGDPSLH